MWWKSRWHTSLGSAVLLILMLALAGCTVQAPPPGRTMPTPTPEQAIEQDIIPSPTPTAVPTAIPTTAPTAIPTMTPAPTRSPTRTPAPAPNIPPAPLATGRVILVSLARQQVYAYQNGVIVFTFTVETGRPELPTPTGVYHIFLKNCSDLRWTNNYSPTASHNVNCVEHNGDRFQEMFSSPWPQSSPNWYAPTHINYAMEFKEGGFYLHDAWWHVLFGPGSNLPHRLPDGSWETGSHGCVGMRIADAERLYDWAAIGTPVYVRANV